MWLRHPEINSQVQKSWNLAPLESDISLTLAQCASNLQKWDYSVFGNVKRESRKLEKSLSKLQQLPLIPERQRAIKECLKQREELLCREESLWAQRSRVDWLKEGDRNTRFFHKKASHRQNRNWVAEIKNVEGGVVQDTGGIQEIFRRYYLSLFSSSGCVQVEDITSKVVPTVTAEMQSALSIPYSQKEIKLALDQMRPTTAPGPDGMPPLFYQHFWAEVRDKVISATLEILNNEGDPTYINNTLITLIPKVKVPQVCSEFRPISLCNVLMKIITKTITNRLKQLLPNIIHENQSGFIPGRLISDNSLIAFETFHYLKHKKKGRNRFCAIKLDMTKAYDRIEWPFLKNMMLALGFPLSFVSLVMRCVTSVQYAIQVNGAVGEFFTPSRGLRQGDPLSPYLFLFCAEGLASLLRHAASTGLIHGIRIARSAPAITHLFFADDSLLFARATTAELTTILSILSAYESASGQKVNMHKSSISFSGNVSSELGNQLRSLLQIREATVTEKYLGLPTTIGRSKKSVFSEIEDRIRRKVGGWKEKSLSRAGRETLIKSVLQAIPTYIMGCFTIPIDTCHRIEQLLCNFFWGGSGSVRKVHWRSWERMCKSKSEGGMGFRRLANFNRAMLAKQAWRLLCSPNSLTAKILKARYYPRSTILDAKVGYSPSHAWRSIMSGLSLLLQGLEWRIGNGNMVKIWSDRWLPNSSLGHPTYLFPGADHLEVVSDLLLEDSFNWNSNLVHSLFSPEDAQIIMNIHLSFRRPIDIPRWKFTPHGDYSVRSGYHADFSSWWNSTHVLSNGPAPPLWSRVWKLPCPPRFKIFLWRVLDNNLPTRRNLTLRGLPIDAVCPLCQLHEESTEHLFLACIKLAHIWIEKGFTNIPHSSFPFAVSFPSFLEKKCSEQQGEIIAILWTMWKIRNHHVFNPGDPIDGNLVLNRALNLSREFNNANYKQQLIPTSSTHHWVKPPSGWMKVNTDACTFPEGGGKVGAILRNDAGTFIAAAGRIFQHVSQPSHLEALGVLQGIDLAAQLGVSKVLLESDCQVVTLALNNPATDRSQLGLIIDDCKTRAASICEFKFIFARREANSVAHHFVKSALFSSSDVCFFDFPPVNLIPLLEGDIL